MNLFKGDDGLDAVDDAAGGDGAQVRECVERGEGAVLGAGFKSFAEQQESEDEQNRIEVDLAAGRGPDGGVGGVKEGDAGAEADQRVHVGGAVAEAAGGAEINAAARPDDEEAGDDEEEPAEQIGRQRVEPGEGAHERVSRARRFAAEGHGEQHGGCAGDEGGEGFAFCAGGELVGCCRESLGAGEDGVVAGGADGLTSASGEAMAGSKTTWRDWP